jgi:cytoskeletal protein CcmA (bactofilin family)
MRCRIAAVTATACAFLLLAALPAGAQDSGGGSDGGGDHGRRISVTGGVVVAADESVDGPVVSADGDARIAGRVNGAVYVGRGDLAVTGRITGDAFVLDGDARIAGRVDGEVTVVNGKATVLPGARVFGNVTSRTTPSAAAGTVRGSVDKLDFQTIFTGFIVVALLLLWITVTLSLGVLGFLFVALCPRAADAVVVAGRRWAVSFLLGLAVGIVGPILGIVIMTTVVGIPLGGAVLGTLAVLGPLGYVASALIFGRLMVKGTNPGARISAFFLGFGILRFAALVPGLGFLVGFVFATYGLGAVTIAGWRAARGRAGAEALRPVAAGESVAPPLTEEVIVVEAVGPAAKPRASTATRARARKAPARKRATTSKRGPAKKKAPAKKRASRAKAAGSKRPAATKSKRAAVKKTGARKPAVKKRPVGAKTNRAKKSSAKKKQQTPRKAAGSKNARARPPARSRYSAPRGRRFQRRAVNPPSTASV